MSAISEYIGAAGSRWVGLVTGSLPVAVLGCLVLFGPDTDKVHHWWNHLPQWVVWSLVLLAVITAQYGAWLAERAKVQALKRQLKERGKENRRAALLAVMDMRFGEYSVPVPLARFEAALALFEKLEAEILSGNFKNAEEFIIFKDFFNPLLKDFWYSRSAPAYFAWRDRLVRALEIVGQHERELADKEALLLSSD